MKIGLALSGGGIRGIAHAGVLKALEENNIQISAIGGTSSGSIIATLYAMGYSPYYIYILFKKYVKDLVNQNSIAKVTNIGSFMTNKKSNFQGFYSGEEIETVFNNVALRKGIKSTHKKPIIQTSSRSHAFLSTPYFTKTRLSYYHVGCGNSRLQ